MRLIFIRHGETMANKKRILSGWTDYPLTKKGIKQCKRLPKKLMRYGKLENIYSSPLGRTVKTSSYIKKNCEKNIKLDDRLKEINFGEFETHTKEEILIDNKENWIKWINDFVNFRIPKGESILDLKNRLEPFLKEKILEDKDIIIVAHTAVIQTAITLLLDLPLKKLWNFQLANGGIVELEMKDNMGFIKRIVD